MNKQPTISVIIPVYNDPDHLMDAIDSALEQTYPPTEIIVVDDHSTDKTLEVARILSQAHRRIRVYEVPQGRQGVSAARNVGLEKATGDLITFLDADDQLRPAMLETLVGIMDEWHADIAGCDFRDGDGRTESFHSANMISQAIMAEHDTRVWSKLYSRRAVEGVTFPEDMTIGEDMLFLVAIASSRELIYAATHQNLYAYTINPKGAMERPFTLSYMDQIRCWDRAEELLQNNMEPETFLRLRAIQVTSAVLVAAKIAALPDEEQEQYKEQWDATRKALRHYLEAGDCRVYLPRHYPQKARWLDRNPWWFKKFCKKRYS